jgi:hypothetical protein
VRGRGLEAKCLCLFRWYIHSSSTSTQIKHICQTDFGILST